MRQLVETHLFTPKYTFFSFIYFSILYYFAYYMFTLFAKWGKSAHPCCIKGPGGTGKSFIIETLVKLFGSRVHVTATTGVGAELVGGVTM